jgi:hypothetical protein
MAFDKSAFSDKRYTKLRYGFYVWAVERNNGRQLLWKPEQLNFLIRKKALGLLSQTTVAMTSLFIQQVLTMAPSQKVMRLSMK